MTSPITYPVKWISRKKYYRVPQSQAITPDGVIAVYNVDNDACSGCELLKLRQTQDCPQHRDPKLACDRPMLCQDYEYDEDYKNDDGTYNEYTILKDYIFIPATHKGIADYVAHLLEAA